MYNSIVLANKTQDSRLIRRLPEPETHVLPVMPNCLFLQQSLPEWSALITTQHKWDAETSTTFLWMLCELFRLGTCGTLVSLNFHRATQNKSWPRKPGPPCEPRLLDYTICCCFLLSSLTYFVLRASCHPRSF